MDIDFIKYIKQREIQPTSVSLSSVSGMIIEQILLWACSTQLGDKKVIWNSQHIFTEGKSSLTHLMGWLALWTREEQWMLHTLALAVFLILLITKLVMQRLDKWTIKENWPNYWAWSLSLSRVQSPASSQKTVASLRDEYWDQYCLMSSLKT